MYETSRTARKYVWGNLCDWKQAACLCTAGAASIDLSTPFPCLKCHCFETPPGVRGLFACFHSVGVKKMSSFLLCVPRGTHTSSMLLLLPNFSLLAKCQHATIFGHKLRYSNFPWRNFSVWPLISGNQSHDNRYSEVHLSGKIKSKT